MSCRKCRNASFLSWLAVAWIAACNRASAPFDPVMGASGAAASGSANAGVGGVAADAASGAGATPYDAGADRHAAMSGASGGVPDAGPARLAADGGTVALQNDARCPATYDALLATKQQCVPNVACAYPQGYYCDCVGRCSGVAPPADAGSPVYAWSCRKPGAGCPVMPPANETACEDTGMSCFYGSCCFFNVRCVGGRWKSGQLQCPP